LQLPTYIASLGTGLNGLDDRYTADTMSAAILRSSPVLHAARDFAKRVGLSWPLRGALLESGIRIQPLPIWEREWAHPEEYSHPRLLHNIAREGLPL